MSQIEYKNWIPSAEQTPTITLNEAKEKWAIQKNRIQQAFQ
jgi:hypothetical protein